MDTSDSENTMSDGEFNIMNMSDEDFAELDPSDFVVTEEEPAEPAEEVEQDDAEEVVEDEAEEDEPEESDEAESDDDDESEEEDQGGDSSSEEPAEEGEETESEEKSEEEGPDYKAVYEELFTPFKANGKEIKVESVEEVRQLMQMGANYSKKMSAIKPNLKTLRLLEDNNLMSDERINYLIDLASGKEGAVKQMLRDSKIDPMDLNLDETDEETYRPSQRTVDEDAMALDEVISDIRGTEHFEALVDNISKSWDDQSRQALKGSPQLLTLLNDHKASGIYDQVTDEVNRRTMLGGLKGLTTLQAYQTVGDQMDKEGKFAPKQEEAPAPKRVLPAKTKQVDPALKSKKRAAGATRKSPTSSAPADFNPLSMSDAEFEKLSSKYS